MNSSLNSIIEGLKDYYVGGMYGLNKGVANLVDYALTDATGISDTRKLINEMAKSQGYENKSNTPLTQQYADYANELAENHKYKSSPALVGDFVGGFIPELAVLGATRGQSLPKQLAAETVVSGLTGSNDPDERMLDMAHALGWGAAGGLAGKGIDFLLDTGNKALSHMAGNTTDRIAKGYFQQLDVNPEILIEELNKNQNLLSTQYPGVRFDTAQVLGGNYPTINAAQRKAGSVDANIGAQLGDIKKSQNDFVLGKFDSLRGQDPAKPIEGFRAPEPGETEKEYLNAYRQFASADAFARFDQEDWIDSPQVQEVIEALANTSQYQKARKAADDIQNSLNLSAVEPNQQTPIMAQIIDQELRKTRDQALESTIPKYNYGDYGVRAADNVFKTYRQGLYDASPQYREAINLYAENSKRPNDFKLGEKLYRKSVTAPGRLGLDMFPQGRTPENYEINPTGFFSALDNWPSLAKQERGKSASIGQSFTPEAKAAIDQINSLLTLQRKVAKSNVTPGSDTARNVQKGIKDMKDRIITTVFPPLSPNRVVRASNYASRVAFDRAADKAQEAVNEALVNPETLKRILSSKDVKTIENLFGPGFLYGGAAVSELAED